MNKQDPIVERAKKAIGAKEVYTLKTIHIQKDGQCLCGFAGTLYKDTNLDTKKMATCGKCQSKYDSLLAEQIKAETRNLWVR